MSNSNKINWLHDICPICDATFAYVKAWKPATCGKEKCVKEFWKLVDEGKLTMDGKWVSSE